MSAEAADVIPPVVVANEPTEAHNAPNTVSEPVATRPARPKFTPKPVAFLPLDIIKYIEELSASERFVSSSSSPALEIVQVGTK